MLDEYDFSQSAPNPYLKRLKKPITIRVSVEAIDYFKHLAGETGIPYQSLMDLYLVQCAKEKKRPVFE